MNITSDVVSIITGVLLVLSVIAGSVMNWVQSRRVTPAPASTPTKTS